MAVLIVLAGVWAMPPTAASAGSLRFFGTGSGDADRVKIPLDAPHRELDVGGAFTIEFWMRARPGENPAGPCTYGNDNWITGHVIVDRDVYGPGDAGDYGVSLFADGVAFGAAVGGSGAGICGGGDLHDDAWHHVAAVRDAGGGLTLWVNGQLADSAPGPAGDLSYRDGRATAWPASDPYLVLAAEKHDAGAAYPSFSGWLDELRLSSVARYASPFVPARAPFVPDGATTALYHFDEGAGDTLRDVAGSHPDHGVLRYGGSPAGPMWSSDDFASGAATAPGRDPAAVGVRVTPQPARANATIRFTLPRASRARASVHGTDGRRVRTWAERDWPAGTHVLAWDTCDEHGRRVPAGLYFVRIESSEAVGRASVVIVR